MVLSPNEFIRLTKNQQTEDTPASSSELKARFRRLSFVFGNKDKSNNNNNTNNNGKTPPKNTEENHNNPLRQSITSIFSKKPPKPGGASPVTSIQNDWIDV